MNTRGVVRGVLVVVLLAVVSACGGGGSSDGDGGGTEDLSKRVAKVVIDQDSLLFTAAGEQRALSAQAFNARGEVLQVPITWQSSNPDNVYVDAAGTLESIANVGSASITASADGVSSAAVVAVVAALASPDDTLTVSDANVVGMALVNPDLPLSSTTQYRVTLTGVAAPAVGDYLLGTEDAPVYGRVVAVQSDGEQVTVTLDIPPIDEMFSELDIAETIDLSRVEAEIPEPVEQLYRMERASDDSLIFTLRDTPLAGTATKSAGELFGRVFTCKSEGALVTIDALPTKIAIKPNVDFIYSYHSVSKLLDMRVKGSIEATAEMAPMVNFTGEGKRSCKSTLAEVPVPISGALAWLVGPSVPFGYGFEIGGKATIAQVGVELKGTVGGQFEAGFKCPSGQPCFAVNSSDGKLDYTSKLLFPEQGFSTNNLRVETWVAGYAIASLKFGVAGRVKKFLQVFFRDNYEFDFLEAKLGPKTSFKLATSTGQILSGSYQSGYGTDMEFSVATTSDTEAVFNYLRSKLLVTVNVVKLDFVGTLPLHTSPVAETLTTTTYDFSKGDPVAFNVSLNPATTTYAGGLYNIREVRIYEDDVSDTGEPMARLLAVQKAQPGQIDFVVNWTADFDGSVGEDFYAFVVTEGLPSIDMFDGLGALELGVIKSVGGSPCGNYQVFLNKECVSYYHPDIPSEAEIAAVIDEPVVCPRTNAGGGWTTTIPADAYGTDVPYVKCRYSSGEVGANLVNQEHFSGGVRTGVNIYFNEDGTIRDYVREAVSGSGVELSIFIDANRFVKMIYRSVSSDNTFLTVNYFPNGTPGVEDGYWGYMYSAGQPDNAGDLWVGFNGRKEVVSVVEFGSPDKYMYFTNGLLTECFLRDGNTELGRCM